MTMEEGGLDSRLEEAEDRDSSIEENPEPRAEYEPGEKVYASREIKDSKQTKSKKGKSNSRKLESIIQESKEEARAFGIDESEYFSAHPEKIIAYLKAKAAEEEELTGIDALGVIYNKKTGEFLLEEKPGDYFYKNERHKLAFIGGKGNIKDHYSSFRTLERELGEEVAGQAGYILKNILKSSGTAIDTRQEIWGGIETTTDLYKLHVKSDKDWSIVRNAKLTHDAGYARILTSDEILSMPNSKFAFDHGPRLKEFILNEFISKNYLSSHISHYTPLVSTTHTHQQSVNSYSKPTISPN